MGDLDRLIAAVEAGDRPWREPGETDWPHAELALLAFDDSLDAALRLHEALLPGWHWRADDGQGQECPFWRVFKFGGTRRDIGEGEAELPARAWLIAVLKALRVKHDS